MKGLQVGKAPKLPAVGNLQAPFIVFDRVAAQGTLGDVVHLELEAVVTDPAGKGSFNHYVTTARVRCSMAALENLKQAIANIELMRQPAAPTKN